MIPKEVGQSILRSAFVARNDDRLRRKAHDLCLTAIFQSVRTRTKETPFRTQCVSESVDPFVLRSHDADEVCAVMAALLFAADYDVRLVLVQPEGKLSPTHCYLQARKDHRSLWTVLDATACDAPGELPPGLNATHTVVELV